VSDPFAPTRDPFRPETAEEQRVAHERTEQALAKTRRSFFGNVGRIFKRSTIDEEMWEDLEETLIAGDTGVETTMQLVERLRKRVDKERLKTPDEAYAALREELIAVLESPSARGTLWADGVQRPQPAVVLVVGVNGTGKTTSIGKLANAYREDGESVLIAAADTFRAAAIDQLKEWGKRARVDVVAHQPGADPGAVVFDALEAAGARRATILIIDTAGRLHNKKYLMDELAKVTRVIKRQHPEAPHEVLLVLDAATGQNGLAQARTFAETIGVTSVFLTKLDGTARGGIVFAVSEELGIPIRFVGTGEGIEDLAPFAAENFVESLLA
jgi:fused signal recognition particle receptor